MKITTYLSSLGISKVESSIFIACYTYGSSSISSLSRLTKVARTTVHDTVQKLIHEGRLLSEKKGKGYLYSATDIDGIEGLLINRKLGIQKQISTLPMIKNEFEKLKVIDHSFTNIQYYQGIQAISTVYKKVESSKTLRAIFNPEKGIEYSDYSTSELTDILITNQVRSFEILGESSIANEYYNKLAKKSIHQVKILPQSEMEQFHADHLITDDKFFFITFGDEILGIEITNKIFVEAQKVIFDSLWNRL